MARIMDEEKLHTRQKWAAIRVRESSSIPPQDDEYNSVFFRLQLHQRSDVTLALSQLDPRYFWKLQGGHEFVLDVVVRKVEEESMPSSNSTYIARTCSGANHGRPARNLALDLNLEAGRYEILLQVSAREIAGHANFWTAEDLDREYPQRGRKIRQLVQNRDAAFRKLEVADPKIEVGKGGLTPMLTPKSWGETICGIGLRVFSQDEGMTLEIGCHKGGKNEEEKDGERGRSSRRSSESNLKFPEPLGGWNGQSKPNSRSSSVKSWKNAGDWGRPKSRSSSQQSKKSGDDWGGKQDDGADGWRKIDDDKPSDDGWGLP